MSGLAEPLLAFLVAEGATLLLGTTLVLAGGCLLVASLREPVLQRRAGVAGAVAVLVYLGLAIVPLPRWASFPHGGPAAATPSFPPPPSAARPEVLPVSSAGTVSALPDAHRLQALQGKAHAAAPAASLPVDMTEAVVPAGVTWPQALAWAWLLSAAATLAWLLLGALRLQGLLRRSRPGPAALARAAGLPERVRLRVLPEPVTPFCCGWLRPTIVLPAALLAPERRAQALAVLRHEAAHLHHGDLRAQACFALLLPLLGWHPLFRWLRARVRFAGELLADDRAARTAGEHGVRAYATALIDLHELCGAGRARPPAGATLAVFHRPSPFFRRIEMLLQRDRALSPIPSTRARKGLDLAAVALVALCGATFGVVPAVAQQDPPPRPQEPYDEAARLRQEVQRLRDEIDRLKAQMRDGAPAKGRAPAPGAVDQPVPIEIRPGDDRHVVRAGDTLEAIARQAYGELRAEYLEALRRANPGLDPRQLRPGQEIVLPPVQAAPRSAFPMRLPVDDVPAAPRAGGVDLRPGSAGIGHTTSITREKAGTGDLLELATRVIQLRAEVELAQTTVAHRKPLFEAGQVSAPELREAEIRLRTAKETLAMAQRLVAMEREDAEAALRALPALGAEHPGRPELQRQRQALEGRIEFLKALR